MTRAKAGRCVMAGVGLAALVGCAAPGEAPMPQAMQLVDAASGATESLVIDQKIAGVAAALLALSPSVNRGEATRAARIAVTEPLNWARDWQVVDPPLVHNFKVVNGLREKGVCQDFADALHMALRAEGLRTLQIHRAIANVRNLRLEHATVILTARGQPMEEGVVLDPWRLGQGQLWFGRVAEDDRFQWETLAAARAYRLGLEEGG